jgi:hypothetical protein
MVGSWSLLTATRRGSNVHDNDESRCRGAIISNLWGGLYATLLHSVFSNRQYGMVGGGWRSVCQVQSAARGLLMGAMDRRLQSMCNGQRRLHAVGAMRLRAPECRARRCAFLTKVGQSSVSRLLGLPSSSLMGISPSISHSRSCIGLNSTWYCAAAKCRHLSTSVP